MSTVTTESIATMKAMVYKGPGEKSWDTVPKPTISKPTHAFDFQIQKLWIQNITLTTGLVNANTTPMLLKTVESKKLQPQNLITHRFAFDQFTQAYEVFGNAAKQKALKVIISNP